MQQELHAGKTCVAPVVDLPVGRVAPSVPSDNPIVAIAIFSYDGSTSECPLTTFSVNNIARFGRPSFSWKIRI
jgi:hypothetical protein